MHGLFIWADFVLWQGHESMVLEAMPGNAVDGGWMLAVATVRTVPPPPPLTATLLCTWCVSVRVVYAGCTVPLS